MQDLRPNAFDHATFILTVIAHDLADPSLPQDPFAFSVTETLNPRRKAVIVNSLWLLSLLFSPPCALMAMSLHQWARRHETIAPQRRSLTEQARIRVFITAGLDSRTFRTVIGILPALVHVSMLLFVVGFVVFLCGVHHVVFIVASCWVALCALGYLYITILPFFRPESPFSIHHCPTSSRLPTLSSCSTQMTVTMYGISRSLPGLRTRGLTGN